MIVSSTVNLHWHDIHEDQQRERERDNKLTDGGRAKVGRRETFGFSTGVGTAFELMYMLSKFGLEL